LQPEWRHEMKNDKSRPRRWSEAVELSALLVGFIIMAELLDWVVAGRLDTLGILPRTWRGLAGILFCPLLHRGLGHLSANAFPLFVLLVLLFGGRFRFPERVLGFIWLGSGLGIWLFARGSAIHIGASAITYGLVVYLIAAGFWMKSWSSMLIAAVVLLLYGGIFYGVLPQSGYVSWEGHLAGAVTGFLVARNQQA
jgi:membrane associated rhomboid family serine protease